MKLAKDFGVRALLACIAGAGFYGLLGYILYRFNFTAETIIAIVAMVQAPWIAVFSWYFATRTVKKPEE
jgi:hypothetical protein